MGVVKPVTEEPTIIISDTASTLSETVSADSGDEEATERTPLVVKPESISSRRRFSPFERASVLRRVSPLAVASVLGLLVGCVPVLKRNIVGEGNAVWQTGGVALSVLGWSFAVVEMVGIGAGLRAAGKTS
jgi:hypothetical protein